MKLDISALLLPATTARPSQTASPPPSRAEEAQAKRFSAMQSALTELRAMPSPRVSAKQAAAQRAAMLKQQLEMMKMMLIGASPEEIKGLAAQIKSIAGELATLARSLSDSGGAAAAIPQSAAAGNPAPVENAVAESHAEQKTAATTNASAETNNELATEGNAETNKVPEAEDKNADTATSASQRQAVAAYAVQKAFAQAGKSADDGSKTQEKAVDSSLQKALGEAKTALRQLINMLKNQARTSPKAAKDIQNAEARLKEIEDSMSKAAHATTQEAPTGPLADTGESAAGEAASSTAMTSSVTTGGIKVSA